MRIENKRNIAADNLRALMIICVVVGHLIEVLPFSYSRHLYVLIYSFHMPVMAFISGMFCKLDDKMPKRIVQGCVYPYLVFQTLYLIFSNFVLREPIDYRYTTPYWLLWYLLAMPMWQVLLWTYSAIRRKKVAMALSFAVALISGMDASIGYFASLSRVLVLFPFFLGGHYLAKNRDFMEGRAMRSVKARIGAVALGLFLSALLFVWTPHVQNRMLYHSYAYNYPSFHAGHRAAMLAFGWGWIGVLFTLVPRVKIPWLTYCGQNTMTIFLFHGFVLRFLRKLVPQLQLTRSWPLFIALCVAIPVVLSLPVSVKACRKLMEYPFGKKKA